MTQCFPNLSKIKSSVPLAKINIPIPQPNLIDLNFQGKKMPKWFFSLGRFEALSHLEKS